MSRFDDHDGDIPYGLWDQIVKRAINGPRGQTALRELEAALLVMPEKRLIDDYLRDGDNVCAIGCVYVYRRATETGKPWEEALQLVPQVDGYLNTVYAGESLGMTHAVASEMAFVNDEGGYKPTPEQRYEIVLRWCREHMKHD